MFGCHWRSAAALFLLAWVNLLPAQNVVVTLAGAPWTFPATVASALEAPVGPATGVAFLGNDLLIADGGNRMLLRVEPSGRLTIMAGTGQPASSGDGGPPSAAGLMQPQGVAVYEGTIYIADTAGGRVRRIRNNVITTIAGGTTAIKLRLPGDVAVDSLGNVYIADTGNARVIRVHPDGTSAVVAENLKQPVALGVDTATNVVYISDTVDHCIMKLTPGREMSVFAGICGRAGRGAEGATALESLLNEPSGIAVQGADIYFADRNNHRVRRIRDGRIETVAGNGAPSYSGDDWRPVTAGLWEPSDVAFDREGNLYITDTENLRIRKVSFSEDRIRTVAGNGRYRYADGAADDALFYVLRGMARDAAGNIYVADANGNRIRKISRGGDVTTLAGTGPAGFEGDNQQARAAKLQRPFAVAVSPDGTTVYIADTFNNRIRKVDANGIITTIAGTGNPTGRPSADNRALTVPLAQPSGLALDPGGAKLYVSDTFNHCIRVLNLSEGTMPAYAGRCGSPGYTGEGEPALNGQLRVPRGLSLDPFGNLFIADMNNHAVRRVNAGDGRMTTVAGNGQPGFATNQLRNPEGVWAGREILLIADTNNFAIRQQTRTGLVTVAGRGRFNSDGRVATDVVLQAPRDVMMDPDGNLLISESLGHRVRMVLGRTPVLSVLPQKLELEAVSGDRPVYATVRLGAVFGMPFTAGPARATWLSVSPSRGVIPGEITLGADPSRLQPGTYTTTLPFSVPGANPNSYALEVSLKVTGGNLPPLVQVSDSRLAFAFTSGEATQAATQHVTIENAGLGVLEFDFETRSKSCDNWFTASVNETMASRARPAVLTVVASGAGLLPSTCEGTVIIRPKEAAALEIPVYMTVSRGQQKMALSQRGLTFTAVKNGGVDPAQNFVVLNAGQGEMDWSLPADNVITKAGGAWLKVQAGSGALRPADAAPIDVEIVGHNSLPVGEHFGQIKIFSNSDNSPQTVSVVLNVLKGEDNPGPYVHPGGLMFDATQGDNPSDQSVTVCNLTGKALSFLATAQVLDASDGSGDAQTVEINVLPRNGTLAPAACRALSVQVDLERATPQIYYGALHLLFGDGATRTVGLRAVVGAAGTGAKDSVSAAGCELTMQVTSPLREFEVVELQPVTLEAVVSDTCSGRMKSGTVQTRFNSGDPSVMLQHTANGVWRGTWQPRKRGRVQLEFWAVAGAGSSKTELLGGNVRGGSLLPTVNKPGGVRDAASLEIDGPVAPGGLVTIFGRYLGDVQSDGSLATEIRLGDKPLKVLAALRIQRGGEEFDQINAVLPMQLTVNTEHELLVDPPTRISVPAPMVVAAARPAIFTVAQNGLGQAVVHYNGAVADAASPAVRGEPVVIFSSGLGGENPDAANITVTIGDKTVTAEGVTRDDERAGVYRVTARVPDDAPQGNDVPVRIRIAGHSSQAAVTMAVR